MKTKLPEVTIRLAKSSEDLEKLYRFRYHIYVEEMGRTQRYADHAQRRIEEPFDATGANFIALAGDELVGCLRWNGGRHTDFGEYVDLYDMRCAGPYFPHHCGTTTKLMVSREYRRTGLVVPLCTAGYQHARAQGLMVDFMDCNPHLESQFAQFGYRAYRPRIQHPEYGNVLPMLLVCPDYDHLAELHSPLAPLEAEHPRNPACVRYFAEKVFHQNNQPKHATQH